MLTRLFKFDLNFEVIVVHNNMFAAKPLKKWNIEIILKGKFELTNNKTINFL